MDKGKLTQEERNTVIGRLSLTIDLKEAVTGADVVIESIFEDMELKRISSNRSFKFSPELPTPASGSPLIARPDAVVGNSTQAPIGRSQKHLLKKFAPTFERYQYFREEFGDGYKPCPIFKKMINAGHLGVKSGKGFYEYRKSA